MHLKRNKVEKSWPIPRKGTKYIVRPSHSIRKGMPLLVVLRDILKVVKTKKEAKLVLNKGHILVNQKVRKDVKFPLLLFDVLSLKPEKKNYRVMILKNKFFLQEIKENETNEKICKVIGKKILKGKKVQINLEDGQNFLTKEKVKVGDSVILNLKDRKIEKILKLEKGAKVFIVKGRHSGETGVVEGVDLTYGKVKIKQEKVKIRLRNIIVVK